MARIRGKSVKSCWKAPKSRLWCYVKASNSKLISTKWRGFPGSYTSCGSDNKPLVRQALTRVNLNITDRNYCLGDNLNMNYSTYHKIFKNEINFNTILSNEFIVSNNDAEKDYNINQAFKINVPAIIGFKSLLYILLSTMIIHVQYEPLMYLLVPVISLHCS